MTREKLVESQLLRSVSRAGGLAYKFTSPSRAGVPDRVVVLPGGRISFVEVKAPGGTLSEIQKVEIARLRKLGAVVHVVWDADGIERVIA
jgi:G:T-mismatch repair DNA endonuclease (very short patch repair protein)